jgi:hypothetical protein
MENSFDYGQLNFDLPHDVVQLPSNGIFYKNKKKSIKVGYLTGSDENILMGNSKDVVISLLRSKIYEHDLRPEDMLEGDIEAILIFLRNTSFGPEMEMTLTDPVTKQTFKHTVVLDRLPLNSGTQPNSEGFFVTTLPKSKDEIKLKPLNYGELLEIQKIIDSYPEFRVAPKVTLRLQKEIVEVNGKTDKSEISKYIDQMPIADSKYIRKFMNDNEPRLDLRQQVIAPSGEKLTFNVGFGAEFFRPFF